MHDRSRVAFTAAARAGLPGRFCAFEHKGLLALLTTSPGLGFLNSVSGLTEESLGALPGVIAVFATADARLPPRRNPRVPATSPESGSRCFAGMAGSSTTRATARAASDTEFPEPRTEDPEQPWPGRLASTGYRDGYGHAVR
jgi:hypothetical protein